ncbi:A disintegrin and metalloproteinase with thrombospondin motifs 15-like isoform X3 [Mytilus californianus]|uniref:A disintegrin and metalloproteinase with thrombospondin motifs 15-like isoform X1 n=1 Tax=Mytilus californianus TaxID=6549 RepID=UPI002247C79D|nr:A disintegrin and metalloproteinase with thrombospondin motifs 15-like isoform X1 [Mytilus californianus]XP_052087380.1 A disintegrin and metalloproteinase with thrombospondin motifs 15-like isoform X2 [Mytilus californianus]XP_052087381.1 A disintegrin and metalloproteinase with thrombospondin motifs 15-like isoform X3 [Mytilus californianus]
MLGIETIVLIICAIQEAYAVTCSEPQLSMCDCVGTRIDCSNRGLDIIPGNIPSNTTSLGMRDNPLKCCTMIDLFEWVSNQTDEFTLGGTCFDFNTTTEFIDQFNSSKCPVDGQWGSWSNPTSSVTCGNGIGSRNRTCDSPEPSEDGKDCVGPRMETSLCNLEDCPGKCKNQAKNQARNQAKNQDGEKRKH